MKHGVVLGRTRGPAGRWMILHTTWKKTSPAWQQISRKNPTGTEGTAPVPYRRKSVAIWQSHRCVTGWCIDYYTTISLSGLTGRLTPMYGPAAKVRDCTSVWNVRSCFFGSMPTPWCGGQTSQSSLTAFAMTYYWRAWSEKSGTIPGHCGCARK